VHIEFSEKALKKATFIAATQQDFLAHRTWRAMYTGSSRKPSAELGRLHPQRHAAGCGIHFFQTRMTTIASTDRRSGQGVLHTCRIAPAAFVVEMSIPIRARQLVPARSRP
jgi:hypothetical protein